MRLNEIEVGDKMWTSYRVDDTVYRVDSIWGPFWWFHPINGNLEIYPYPMASFCLSLWGNPQKDGYGINDIHEEDGKFIDQVGDEIFVEKIKKTPQPLEQFDMFSLLLPEEKVDDPRMHPYVFQPGVDYSDPKRVYKCNHCGLDFNSPLQEPLCYRDCPKCGKYEGYRIYKVPPYQWDKRNVSVYLFKLNNGIPL